MGIVVLKYDLTVLDFSSLTLLNWLCRLINTKVLVDVLAIVLKLVYFLEQIEVLEMRSSRWTQEPDWLLLQLLELGLEFGGVVW